ncbi:hypothetical protein AFAEC_0603 [Aliarcobacter faecis]|uniref:hypothetical protein n=1 Tax=Aliarcobacter faecis TaxID=1564138 RepID=UPI00047E41D3|nr:hypothetical protein [Aliarcobacter faecis]QKF72794.1 hypothetical protein AFAEC_0603 [Aliarcobacter faecis]
MADFSLPTLVTTYADFLTQMKQRDEDIIKMLDGTTTSNLPSGAKRWNTSGNKWEKYNGSVWSDLSTLYEIKVRDSDKLNGQAATYYAIASHTHTGYAALNHTHSDYALVGHNHDSAYLGKSAQASDSAKLTGYSPSMATNPTTIGLRDASGDFYARLFRSTYAEQTSAPAITADICFRNDAINDNYMRFMSSDAFKSWLASIGVSITDTNTWRSITDSVSTESSTIGASATAVNIAYNKGVEALNKANTVVTTTAIGTAIVSLSNGSVGSYAFMNLFNEVTLSYGQTVAGSNLSVYHINGTSSTRNFTGTWKYLGRNDYFFGLFLRIA